MSGTGRRRLPRQVREQQIIDAGVRVFSKRGYHAAVVDEIAELADISKPMVYLYFGSKEGLFIACIRREGERLTRGFQEAASAGKSADEQLWAGLSAFFGYVAATRDGWVVLYRQAPEQGGEIAAEVRRQREAVMAAVVELVRSGASGSGALAERGGRDAEFVAHALVGAADSLTGWMADHPGETPDKVTLRLMNMVWVGMRNVLDGEVWVPPDGDSAAGE